MSEWRTVQPPYDLYTPYSRFSSKADLPKGQCTALRTGPHKTTDCSSATCLSGFQKKHPGHAVCVPVLLEHTNEGTTLRVSTLFLLPASQISEDTAENIRDRLAKFNPLVTEVERSHEASTMPSDGQLAEDSGAEAHSILGRSPLGRSTKDKQLAEKWKATLSSQAQTLFDGLPVELAADDELDLLHLISLRLTEKAKESGTQFIMCHDLFTGWQYHFKSEAVNKWFGINKDQSLAHPSQVEGGSGRNSSAHSA